jgi:hypothetical protein
VATWNDGAGEGVGEQSVALVAERRKSSEIRMPTAKHGNNRQCRHRRRLLEKTRIRDLVVLLIHDNRSSIR